MANAWSAARARISSLVMKAAAAANLAEAVAAVHAAIEAEADDCRRLSIGEVSSGTACATWVAYGHKLHVCAQLQALRDQLVLCMCATSSGASLSRNATRQEARRETCV